MAESRVWRECAACGGVFWPRLADVRRNKARYCSIRCRHTASAKVSERASATMRWADIDGEACALVRLASAPQDELVLDPADLDWFLDYPRGWAISRTERGSYAQATAGMVRLHRLLLPVPVGQVVDHRNGDTLDCRRSNLRPATAYQNSINRGRNRGSSSHFIGVHWHSLTRKWTAQVKDSNGRRWSVGFHRNEEEAALARDGVAYHLRGEFARLNFPDRLEEAARAAFPIITRISGVS